MDENLDALADPARPNNAYRLFRERMASGDTDGAEWAIQSARAHNPQHPTLLSALSEVAARRGDHEAAVGWLEKAIELNPGALALHLQLVALHAAHDPSAADAVLQTAHAIAPDDLQVLRRLSEHAYRHGDLPAALGHAERMLDLSPSAANFEYLATVNIWAGDLAAAEAATQAGLASHPEASVLLRRQSDLAARRNDFASMLKWARQAIAAHPNDPEPHKHLANWHVSMGHFAAAWDGLNAALALNPADTIAMRRASEVSARQGDLMQAFYWVQRAIAARPDIAAAYGELATLHLHAGDLAGAKATLETGLSRAPVDAGLLRRLAYVEAMAS